MEQALLQLVPLGLAAALSSVPITATVFILLSESRNRSGLAFLAGTVLGTLAAVTLATVAGQAIPGRQRRHDELVATIEVIVGAAMVLLGTINLARRDRTQDRDRTSWLPDNIGSFGVVPVFGIALALNVRPKAVLLVTAAGLAISGNLRFEENLVLTVLYTAIATNTTVIPIVATVLAPEWMEPRLRSTKNWITGTPLRSAATMTILVGGFVMAVGIRS